MTRITKPQPPRERAWTLPTDALICAVRAGTKTAHHFPINPQPVLVNGGQTWEWPHESTGLREGEVWSARTRRMRLSWASWAKSMRFPEFARFCPLGRPGDRLRLREAFADVGRVTVYRADREAPELRPDVQRWRSAGSMPMAMARTVLEVVAVTAAPIQDINDASLRAEGITGEAVGARAAFRTGWDEMFGETFPWSRNPWAWGVSFRVVA